MAKRKKKARVKFLSNFHDVIRGYPSWLAERPTRTFRFVRNLKLQDRGKRIWRRTTIFIERKPFTSFFSLLGILLLLIIIGSIIRRPAPEKTPPRAVKSVVIYKLGATPKVTVAAQVEKSGVIKIVALAPGVVSGINVVEGQVVSAGTNLVSLASNYSGGNAASIQRQLAAAQYQNVKDTADAQKDIISKQREIADQNKTNTDKLRGITNQSIQDTQGLLNINNEILGALTTNYQTLKNNNAPQQDLLPLQQQIAQLSSGIAQLNSALRQSQYQVDTNNPPTKLADLQHDVAIKQLDIQQKALDLSLSTSALQLQLAHVNESTYFPTAPFDGVVERVYVTEGEVVNPGTPLLTLHGDQTVKIVAKVPASIASKVSRVEASTFHVDSKTFQEVPLYISNEATDGQLYSVLFEIPALYQDSLTNNSFIQVDIPIGVSASAFFIPIDAVYQGQNNTYVFVNSRGTAKSKTVNLGSVFGEYVEVKAGLLRGDEVIISRSVIEGDKVKIQ